MPQSQPLAEIWNDPPATFRSAPFWSWNSKLDPKRLARAIRQMHQAGMGGFFMHSRYGLKTAYLSDAWFQCVAACIDQARQLDMHAYLYDEDRWPSGFAGGQVTRDLPQHRVHQMVVSVQPEPPQDRQRLAQFRVEYDEKGRVIHYDPIDGPEPDASPANFLAVDLRTDEPNPHFNDGTYLDVLSADAVAEFLRTTHQAYADRFGEQFGPLVPAVFTDEPNYRVRFTAEGYIALPFTPDLPQEFIRRRGYDLRDHLVELFRPMAADDFSPLRCDYFRTIAELFVENFSAQIGQWCENHNLALTGHMLAEGTLLAQSMTAGACMPHYRHMQWPGIDVLRDRSEMITAKQCTSVAAQTGKERTLSELYGCTGWDWPLEGHKYVGDWHLAAGINFRCPHLTHYSLAGGAKRDYPASIFAHSPWWKYYRHVEDYFARCHALLTDARPIRDVLVLHPIESAWGLLAAQQLETGDCIRRLDQDMDSLIHALTGEHYDWDFGDESILADLGKVAGNRLQVGQMSYAVVLVPSCRTLRSSTVELLEKLQAAGGEVIFTGLEPDYLDARPLESGKQLLPGARRCSNDWLETLESLLARRVSIKTEGKEDHDVWALLGQTDFGHVLWLQSHQRQTGKTVTVQCAAQGPVVRWDPLTAARYALPTEKGDGTTRMELNLPPTGSALLTFGLDLPDALPEVPAPTVVGEEPLAGPYRFQRSEPNSLPLDTCSYRIGEGNWSEPMDVLAADKEIRAAFDLPPRRNNGAQPWYLYQTGVVDTAVKGKVELLWQVQIQDVPSTCRLALEAPEDFTVEINGQTAGEPEGWWVDEDLRTIDVSELLEEGTNRIVLSCNYRPDMEIESLYLLGEFATVYSGAKLPAHYRLTKPGSTLDTGSWVGQGLDFYTGSVTYKVNVRRPDQGHRAVLRLPAVSCTAAALHVGKETFFLPWAPFEADITDALCDEDNEVGIEVIGGRKNTLGPLHTPWGPWTGPGQFDPDAPDRVQEYLLTDHGLMEPPVLEIRQP